MSIPILPLAEWPEGINQASIPANDNANRLGVLNGQVISKAVTAQPAGVEGAIYILPGTHTGAQWSTFDEDDLTIYKGGTWHAFAPIDGVVVNFSGHQEQFTGSGGWTSIGGGSFSNPMTTAQDLIKATAGGAPVRLGVGSNGQVLSVTAGAVGWATPSAGFVNPMTTAEDIIKGGASGAAARLAAGSNGQVLTVTTGAVGWATPSAGFSNPMTTTGDVIYSSSGSTPARLGVGSSGQVLTVAAGIPSWATPSSGFVNPMTTIGDVIVGSTAGAAIRLANGTAGYVLTAQSGAPPAWAAASGGGLTGLTSALNTASPNATTNVSSLTASGGTTDQDIVIAPKNGGALLARIPDSTATGGNRRGFFAVDLQTSRDNAAQVASGANSVIAGGDRNTASGQAAMVGGGNSNSATSTSATVAGGDRNLASAANSAIAGGSGGSTRAEIGLFAHASGAATVGSAQYGLRVHRVGTTNATPTRMSVSATTPAATTVPVLAQYAYYAFTIRVVGAQFFGSNVSAWVIEGAIKNVGGTTTIVGTPVIRMIGQDAGAAAWACTVQANNTLDSLEVEVTGAAATTIEWRATIETTEMTT